MYFIKVNLIIISHIIIVLTTFTISTSASAGFFDDLKKQVEDNVKEIEKSAKGSIDKITGKEYQQPTDSASDSATNENSTSSGQNKTINGAHANTASDSGDSGWKNPLYLQLTRLAMQMYPQKFNHTYAYYYDLWDLTYNTKECNDAIMNHPDATITNNEFAQKHALEKSERRIKELLDAAKNATPVSRTFIYSMDGSLRNYDFDKKTFDLSRIGNEARITIYKDLKHPPKNRICGREYSAQSREMMFVDVNYDRRNLNATIPMNENEAEQYTNKYGKRVTLDITLEVTDMVSFTSTDFHITLNATIKRIKVRSEKDNSVLADWTDKDLDGFAQKKKQAAKPQYRLDTSWKRPQKSIDVRDQAVQGVRLGMTYNEAKHILESKGYADPVTNSEAATFEKSEGKEKRTVTLHWGRFGVITKNRTIFSIYYNRDYPVDAKFDVAEIQQQIFSKLGKPDEGMTYWSWPSTTEEELQLVLSKCQDHVKKGFDIMVAERKKNRNDSGGGSGEGWSQFCPDASVDDINKLIEYANVPTMTVQIIGDYNRKQVTITENWDYLFEKERTKEFVAKSAKMRAKPTSSFDIDD